jgi:hypothetical protein
MLVRILDENISHYDLEKKEHNEMHLYKSCRFKFQQPYLD